MDLATLKDYVKKAPNGPGIYKFLASRQELYVGKATSLKKRLASYLKTSDPRIRQIIDKASGIELVETGSDIEALILESQLIKRKQPMFNVMSRDDKQYFYVSFSHGDFSRIFLTHQSTKSADADFVGPFTDGTVLKATLKYLRTVFPYCTCNQKHHNYCLNYHIGKCLGICCLRKPEPTLQGSTLKEQYRRNVKAIKNILSGRKQTLVRELKKEMETSAKAHKFERAIELRTTLERLERVLENARIIRKSPVLEESRSGLRAILKLKDPIVRIEGYDVSNIHGSHATGSMVAFVHGEPDKNYYRKFTVRNVSATNDIAMLSEVLKRRLRHPEWPFPDLILVDGGKGQVNAARATLTALNIAIPVIGLSKDEHHRGNQLVFKTTPGWRAVPLAKLPETDRNLLLNVDSEAHRFAISHYRHLHRKSL